MDLVKFDKLFDDDRERKINIFMHYARDKLNKDERFSLKRSI